MTKPSPTRYRTTNWSSYNAALKRRGSLLIWLDRGMIWYAPREDRSGRPAVFSDAAILFCLTIKVLFKLPLRQTCPSRLLTSQDANSMTHLLALLDVQRRKKGCRRADCHLPTASA